MNICSSVSDLQLFMDMAGNNHNIVNAIAKAWDMLGRFQRPVCSISGGSDSDIMLDIIFRLDYEKKVRYVFFNTGLEMKATKRHLDFLESRYGIHIERLAPVKSVTLCAKQFGVPFLNKRVSDTISRLQQHGFDFKDEPYDIQIEKYHEFQSGIKWWHNRYIFPMHNISYNSHLKDFLIAYPPTFSISSKCCTYAKKDPAKKFYRDNSIDLSMIGTRKSEGGIRSAFNNCVTVEKDSLTKFRPVFWLTDKDKETYKKAFGIQYSDCYEVWGFKRTGCVGCPFNRNLFSDLDITEKFEPQLCKAAHHVFGKSYSYTMLYRQFCQHFGTRSLF